MPASTDVSSYLADCVRQARRRYRKRLGRCRDRLSERAVHDLRVEVRRTLALLGLIEMLGFGGPLKKVAKQFKRRLDVFDEFRDLHVQLGLLKQFKDVSGARPIRRLLCRRETKLGDRLARRIKSTKYSRLAARLKPMERCVRRGESHTTRQALAALIQLFQRAIALRRRVRADDPATLHRLRVAFKRFRYLSEWLQPLLPSIGKTAVERMKKYQAAAGEIQDLEALRLRLEKLVRDGDVSAGCARDLQRELLLRRREAINSFMARVDDLFEFRKHLRAPAETPAKSRS